MDTIAVALGITIAVAVASPIFVLCSVIWNDDTNTYAHRHRYGDSIGGYYQHTHWYANPHGHTQPRDPAADTTANRYDEWTGIVA